MWSVLTVRCFPKMIDCTTDHTSAPSPCCRGRGKSHPWKNINFITLYMYDIIIVKILEFYHLYCFIIFTMKLFIFLICYVVKILILRHFFGVINLKIEQDTKYAAGRCNWGKYRCRASSHDLSARSLSVQSSVTYFCDLLCSPQQHSFSKVFGS